MQAIDGRPNHEVKTIVLATDFSSCSQNAAIYAKAIAQYFSASLYVAHAFTLSQPAMEIEASHSMVSQLRKDLQARVSKIALELSSGTMTAMPVLLEGDPKFVVPQFSEKQNASLIILGTHGGGRVEREFVGSVAEGILQTTAIPCITVGPNVPPALPAAFPFRRILFAGDYTSAAAQAVIYACGFARHFGATLETLNVLDSIHEKEGSAHPQSEFSASLERALPAEVSKFCNPRAFIDTGDARIKIVEHIRRNSIDLLVLGINKKSHFGLAFRDSHAFETIIDAPVPVLTVSA